MIHKISMEWSEKYLSFKSSENKNNAVNKLPVASRLDSTINKGLDVSAAYNIGLLYAKNKNIKQDESPLKPICDSEDLESIKGEKIYNNNGTLRHIIIRDEDTIEYYIPDKNDNSKLEKIEIIDKKTGKLVKVQTIYNENDENGKEYKIVRIHEYSVNNPNDYREAEYINGELRYTTNKTEQNGKVTEISYDYTSKTCTVSDYNADNEEALRICANIDKNKQIQSYEECGTDIKGSYTITYYEGTPISYYTNKHYVLSSDAGKDKLANFNIKPAEKEEKPKDLRRANGEKTYYSNGALESNTVDYRGQKIKAFFNDDGRLTKISTIDKEVEFDGENQKIREKLDKNIEKITEFSANVKFVTLKDNDAKSYKSAYYTEDNKAYHYEEGILNKDGDIDSKISMWFDESGNLSDYYDFNY